MAGFILEFIPLYHFGKVCILIWMFNPTTKGATTVYKQLLQPILRKYKHHLEAIVKEIQTMAKEATNTATPTKKSE